ncbi:UDP-N-acetylglucosamine 2-epimerase [Oceanisphaera pacifica]|uniref:UDP-N-acetylglucosamine 2-epimerase (Hydrolyzing) n=1 Tax=Oceanisphaera pacifica TaxID=2818389 RepID=A0ABS3NGR4_9GAMM|nr:UDP-N-acetylglucosamine 2-epimerase [Oceanisphaera pacifica]MBO1519715.1 UDP-N-acetylglucosamine 2-epimerase (hydrolyzing) [Oceanisphaera pacifica]
MRKIAVFTGTRAEYGLLYWIIKALNESKQAQLQLLVGGMHLSPEFGYTISQIEKDDFPIAERMEFLLSSDSPVAISKSMGLALIGAAEALQRHQPDLVVILGDRFESMAVAQAAMVAQIPIAHLHGGEKTEGLIDEAVRHSITKMAHLHFTATEEYRQRVIQLGEQPHRVFNFGAPGIDSIVRLPLLARAELSNAINFKLDRPYFLVTYHPVTLASDGAAGSLKNLLAVLDAYPNHQVIISYPNADTNGRQLIEILEAYRDKHPQRVHLVQSLGQLRYLSVMKHCEAVLGNSSSGLIEAPTFGIPTLNIGNRQKGRLSGKTIVHCEESRNAIKTAMELIMDPYFKKCCRQAENPYGKGNSSEKIVERILVHPLKGIVSKSFFDMVQS